MHLTKGCLAWFVGECSQGEWMVPSHCRDRTCPSGREGWQNQALSMEQHFHILEHWPQTGLDPFLVHCSYKALGFHSMIELQTCCMCWAMCPAAVTPRLRCALHLGCAGSSPVALSSRLAIPVATGLSAGLGSWKMMC